MWDYGVTTYGTLVADSELRGRVESRMCHSQDSEPRLNHNLNLALFHNKNVGPLNK